MLKAVSFLVVSLLATNAAENDLQHGATRSLERAVAFFRTQVAVEGTYLWQYSSDLTKREGEGKAAATQGWIQPPGTPAVGMAFLDAWNATSDRIFLDAAQETARGLLRAQVRSGGWHYSVDFDPAARKKVQYRVNGGNEKARNVTTFDDDTTQAALRFLIRLDQATAFKEPAIREAIDYVIAALKKSQYPNGAWPQGYDAFPDHSQFPVKRASLPPAWPRTWPGSQKYWLNYTFNDNSLATLLDTLFEAASIYSKSSAGPELAAVGKECQAAALRAADFILIAQLPEPQPAWAQQYNAEMHPIWARKFEPPAVSGAESQGIIRTLMKIYAVTGDRKYLEPIPRALAYLKKSRLSDGRLARFYELGSNKPLYFTKDYQLTYSDSDMPTHYAFKVADSTEALEREYERVKAAPPTGLPNPRRAPTTTKAALKLQIEEVIRAQDKRGAWVENGRLRYHGDADPTTQVIRCSTFIRNVDLLSEYLQAR